ncbi:hypothetical protein ACFYP4_20920 [Streptomyces sp. NPDC005551]|uniref:hypothetical protein n=1 Tax=Streptomyces sp. NPDC005551 TaxID=3364725 RepID=UPI0036CAB532
MSTSPLAASQVQVVLSDCSAADAGSLFAALCSRFSSDRCAEDRPHETEGNRPTMWTGTFDTSGTSGDSPVPPTELSAPVTADVQGGPLAVKHLREALAEAFTVHQLGEEAGDQEVEIQLRLENKSADRSTAI